ncbi:hypothetical protein NC653_027416 [Populus alba x Populus x berolinensis]|uniref:RRM domain-containing protein n=1 Tax=Populus alba x Populus x berolinensis TaxID=444605 RepID=A0AAD6Q4U1_9ROSI|nr:hypothetical protein NC653_027416 [Populus alba x Populus x berolinensis]
MYYIFGKYGVIHKIQTIINKDTKGTTFMVFLRYPRCEKPMDHLSRFNVENQYLIVLYLLSTSENE